MALTTKANVLIIAPHLSTASDDLWNQTLADVGLAISASVFGTKTEWAARHWVAHHMTLYEDDSSTGSGGPVIKDKVGDVMKEYAGSSVFSKNESDYSRTKYGRTFMTIRSSCYPVFEVIVPGV